MQRRQISLPAPPRFQIGPPPKELLRDPQPPTGEPALCPPPQLEQHGRAGAVHRDSACSTVGVCPLNFSSPQYEVCFWLMLNSSALQYACGCEAVCSVAAPPCSSLAAPVQLTYGEQYVCGCEAVRSVATTRAAHLRRAVCLWV
ncbi:hypothetical protein VPH35_029535 [Triticum aestivum]